MGFRLLDNGLNDRQQRFVEEYLVDLDVAGAAIRAGYSPIGASVTGSRLLSHVKVAAAVAKAQQKRSQRTEVTADRVVAELASIAFADPGDVMEWGPNGVRVKPSGDLTPEQRTAVAEVVTTTGKDTTTVRVKLHDKLSALDQLARHTGLYSTGNDRELPGDIDPCEELEQRLREISERMTVERVTVTERVTAEKARGGS